MGLLMALGAAALAPLFGLPEPLVRTAGLLLLPLAAFIVWLASRPAPPRALVWVVILGNVGWTAESFVVARPASADRARHGLRLRAGAGGARPRGAGISRAQEGASLRRGAEALRARISAAAGDAFDVRRVATCFSSSSCCSSPASNISIMMSEPPTNSPLT